MATRFPLPAANLDAPPCRPSRSPCRDGRSPPGTPSGASAWSPALPHHSIARSSRPALREMMGDDFGLSRGALADLAQDFGGAAVQRLAAALEQAVVGGVLDQRVLEAIAGLQAARPRRTEGRLRQAAPTTLAASARRLRRRHATAAYAKSRPRTAPICATSRAGPSRSRRAASDCCKVGGMA